MSSGQPWTTSDLLRARPADHASNRNFTVHPLWTRANSPTRRHAIDLFTPAAEAGSVHTMATVGILHLGGKEVDDSERRRRTHR